MFRLFTYVQNLTMVASFCARNKVIILPRQATKANAGHQPSPYCTPQLHVLHKHALGSRIRVLCLLIVSVPTRLWQIPPCNRCVGKPPSLFHRLAQEDIVPSAKQSCYHVCVGPRMISLCCKPHVLTLPMTPRPQNVMCPETSCQ